jgi:hypothetical protein
MYILVLLVENQSVNGLHLEKLGEVCAIKVFDLVNGNLTFVFSVDIRSDLFIISRKRRGVCWICLW